MSVYFLENLKLVITFCVVFSAFVAYVPMIAGFGFDFIDYFKLLVRFLLVFFISLILFYIFCLVIRIEIPNIVKDACEIQSQRIVCNTNNVINRNEYKNNKEYTDFLDSITYEVYVDDKKVDISEPISFSNTSKLTIKANYNKDLAKKFQLEIKGAEETYTIFEIISEKDSSD